MATAPAKKASKASRSKSAIDLSTNQVDDVVSAVSSQIFGNGKSKQQKLVPPGTTSTTTPAGIATHDPDALPPKHAGPALGPVFRVRLTDLVPHPDNVERSDQEIKAMAESLKEDHQREPLVVRRLPKDEWQILSGHRRYFGARKLGWDELDARERLGEISEGQALVELAAYNGQRSDLDTIAKAELIAKLCKPIKEGGKVGLTRAAAAKYVGAKDHSTASNLVRLLELPKDWQFYVRTGEVPWTWALRLVPYAKSPTLMKRMIEAYEEDKHNEYAFENNWSSRDAFEDSADSICRENCRPLGARWYGAEYFEKDGIRYQGTYPCLIELDEDLRLRLEIIEVEDRGEVACNLDLFDKLQREAIVRQVDAQRAKEEAKAGKASSKSKAAGKQPDASPSKANLKEAAEQRKAQLVRQLDEWKQDVARRFVADCMNDRPWLAQKAILYWLTFHSHLTNWQGIVHHALAKFTATKAPGLLDVERMLDAIRDDESATVATVATAELLLVGSAHHQPAPVSQAVLLSWLSDCDLSIEDCWREIQQQHLSTHSFFANFFEIFRKDELLKIAEEYDVYLDEKLPKGQMVKLLTMCDRTLPLPKCLEDKPAKKTKR